MSISTETIKAHLKDPAVLCCLRRKGVVISPDDLEDPTIFQDLVDSNLLALGDDVLTIEAALGATLVKDCDGLTPLTADILDGGAPAAVAESADSSVVKHQSATVTNVSNGYIHLEVDSLKGLKLDIPEGVLDRISNSSVSAPKDEQPKETTLRTLVHRYYTVSDVKIGDKTDFNNGILTIDEKLVDAAVHSDQLVKKVSIKIIKPNERHLFTNTMMDVIPVAVKVEGILGSGSTNVLGGVVFLLTGMDEIDVQIHEFGSSEGMIDEKIRFGRPGCPDENDIIIMVDVQIEKNTGMERRGPFAAHTAVDCIIEDIRKAIKSLPAEEATTEKTYKDIRRQGRPRVVLVKEIMGQGAMHDNLIMPVEPCGLKGGHKNVDLGNVPIVLSPNEVRDGGIHALACIGPATKEITRHFFREPLVHLLADDEEIDLVGVVFIGSPQVNDEKSYVASRLGSLVEAMNVEGAIVTTEGFGNNHIDFAANIESIGSRGIPVVGVTFAAYQGQLVVGNQYMDAMIELNKDNAGFENEILADNTLTSDDAKRALLMLKSKMAGVPIQAADHQWKQSVIDDNQVLVNKIQGDFYGYPD